MKFSVSSVLFASAAWTVQAMPTAIPSSMGGRARAVSADSRRQAHAKKLTEHMQLPYNAVRSIYQSQRRLARQESMAASDAQVPDATSLADIPMSEPLPPTSMAIMTSDPAVITSGAEIPTSEPLPSVTTDVIISEPTEITSVADIPTTEPLLPPTTTDEITSEAITIPQTFLVKVRQQTQVATPIETFPATPAPVLLTDIPTAAETLVEFPTLNLPTDVPTAVETLVETPTPVIPTDIPTAVETSVESPTAVLPTAVPTAVETLIARSPSTDTSSPPTTTSP